MKKFFALITLFLILFSSLVYAGGDKVRSDKGQGSIGTSGGGATTQTRGKLYSFSLKAEIFSHRINI